MEPEANDENSVPERTERLVVTVGRVWREERVTCPHRDILMAYRQDALKPEQADYLKFHIEEAECPYCQAQLEDLARTEATASDGQLDGLKERLLTSTMTFLRKEKTGKLKG